MRKNLVKIGAGMAAVASGFYWGVLPALAVVVPLCPPKEQPQPPGCLAGVSAAVSTGAIIQSAVNLLFFVAFIVALVFLIVGGIKWIMSGGDKEGSGKAKDTVTSALIGLVIVIGSWVLINILLNFFGVATGISGLNIPILQWQGTGG